MKGWSQVPLSTAILEAKPGFACGDDLTEGVFQFRMNNVTVQGGIDLAKMRRIPASIRALDTFLVQQGDVLFNATNSPELVGKAAYFPGLNEPAVFSNHFLRLRPSPESDGRYLARWLNYQFQRGVFRGMCRQWVNQATVNRDSLLGMSVPLPSIHEQSRIADILDKADALRAKRRASQIQLDEVRRSMFLEMFADPLGQKWPMTTVGEVADSSNGSIRTGPFGSQLLHSEFSDSGIAVLGIDNAVMNEFRWAERRFITAVKYRELKRYTVRPGDVLITIMGTCGRCAIVPDDVPVAVNTKHLCCITLDRAKCLPEFLHSYFLLHPISRRYLRQTAKGAIMSGLNMEIISAMPIPMVPIELQAQFARSVARISKLNAVWRRSGEALEALFASLQHRAFRGEL